MKELIEPRDCKAYLISVIAASVLMIAIMAWVILVAWGLYKCNHKETNFKIIKVKHI